MTNYIIGSDECGYGAIAGPLVVCAVLVPDNWRAVDGLRDSKKLSEKQIERLSGELVGIGVKHYIYSVSSEKVDRGVYTVLYDAHVTAVQVVAKSLPNGSSARVVVDGNRKIEVSWPCEAMVGADDIVPAVMAASILGKNFRNRAMRTWAKTYPLYGFETNQGYPTPEHKNLLKKYGATPIHRKSYAPVKEVL